MNTSPCSIGFIVPASTLRYGSIFTRFTERPRAVKSFPIEAVAIPLPTPDMTPPTTKMYLWPPALARPDFRYAAIHHEKKAGCIRTLLYHIVPVVENRDGQAHHTTTTLPRRSWP